MQCRFINNVTLVRRLFVGVAETVVGWLVCCGMGIVQCITSYGDRSGLQTPGN